MTFAHPTPGDRIRATRKARGLTAQQVGEAVGRDRQTVYRWEWGDVEPRHVDLVRVAQVLRVSPSWLAFGEGEGPAESAPPESG